MFRPRSNLLREQAIRFIGPAIGAIIGFGLIFVVVNNVFQGHAPSFVIYLMVGACIISFLVVAVVIVVSLRWREKYSGDRIEGALRDPDADWTHGSMAISAGRLSFQPYFDKVRIPTGEAIELAVHAISDNTADRPSVRDIRMINPQLNIIHLTTSRGPKDLAVLPSRIDEILRRLTEENPDLSS